VTGRWRKDRAPKHTPVHSGDRAQRRDVSAIATLCRRSVLTISGKIVDRRAFPVEERNNARIERFERMGECVVSEVVEYKSWVCLICGWIYNEEEGLPEDGIAAGTRFADIPEDWRCPLCDVSKSEFAVVEF
jgi:rubredoxin